MHTTDSGRAKGRAVAIVAVIALIAAALGATYAWTDYRQHKSNELNGAGIRYEARLVENFAEVKDWKVEDEPVPMEVSVANKGQASQGYGDVYVRVQLKEYMEIAPLVQAESSKRYMIDTKGDFVVYATQGEAQAAVSAGGPYPGHAYAPLTDIVTGASGYFIETQDRDPNGQMGKHVVTGSSFGAARKVIDPGPARAADTGHHGHPSEECAYALHMWRASDALQTREYNEWLLGSEVVQLSAWDGVPAAKWIIDDESDSGWAYWGRALAPGESSAKLLDKVALVKQPDGSFYYIVHADMEAVSLDEIADGNVDWGAVGASWIGNAQGLRWDGPTPNAVYIGWPENSPGVLMGNTSLDPSLLTWSSNKPQYAMVNSSGVVTGLEVNMIQVFDENGVLIGVERDVVIITATLPNGASIAYTIKVDMVYYPQYP